MPHASKAVRFSPPGGSMRSSRPDRGHPVASPPPGRLGWECPPDPIAVPEPRSRPMSEPSSGANELQQKYLQFLELTPLATALAGLPPSEGRLLVEEQVEARAVTARAAYRMARSLWDELTGGDAAKGR